LLLPPLYNLINELCLAKVLDKTSVVARSMGWPDQAITATRAQLESASKVQTELIDQIVEGWKKQLESRTAPLGIPGRLARHPDAPASAFSSAVPEFNPLAPWTFWLQAAQAWQETWMPTSTDRSDRQH
jgi:hypothetical protein